MFFIPPLLALAILSTAVKAQDISVYPKTIVVGQDPAQTPASVGWTDGVCYKPLMKVHPGDTLEFNYDAHNVYQMASKKQFMDCDFTDATLLSQVGESPFRFEVPTDARELYFACQVGSHCASGTQKLQVLVSPVDASERTSPVSSYLIGTSVDDCQSLQENLDDEAFDTTQQPLGSECSEPILGEDGYYTRSCLSGPATLTPGGVINRLFVLFYPYPKDHRVALGQRTFEFVHDVPGGEGIVPVPVNQLYIHHLSGRVVFGQGAEGLRQEAPDAPFASPYVAMTGDEGDTMIFHLIDLREVNDWLSCIECRCPASSGNTYFDELTQTGNITGGVNCCSNCTDLTGPTLDYRMRYNVSYKELDEEEPVNAVQMLTADISPAVDKILEHDVASWEYMPEEEKGDYHIQRLERVEPFNKLFKQEFFETNYNGPDEVKLIRCVAHLHVASIDMWLEDMETGEILCSGTTTYGTDPETDKGFLIAVNVDNHDPPKTFPKDRMVRFVTQYNATQVHTGVMGYWFVFVESPNNLTQKDVNMTVSMCLQDTCDASMLPTIDVGPFEPAAIASPAALQTRQTAPCVDTLAESPSCTFGGLCECEDFVNAPESSGCDGFYASPMGDIMVRSVCAKYCGCDVEAAIENADGGLPVSPNPPVQGPQSDGPPPPSGGATPFGCADSLKKSPMCSFAGICECEDFVNAPESEGCGGFYRSEMGDIAIDDVCQDYCGACVDVSAEELFEKVYVDLITEQVIEKCKYATAGCQAMLSNLYSCGSGKPGLEAAHPMVQAVVGKRGQDVAMASAQIGHPSLHAGEQPQDVQECAASPVANTEPDTEPEEEAEPSRASGVNCFLAPLLALFSTFLLLRSS